jgi:hypothetical protein
VVVLILAVVAAPGLACGANYVAPPAPTSTPLPLPTQPPPTEVLPTIPPSDTPVLDTPTPVPTETPSEVTVTASAGEVACRFGPAAEYSIDGKLAAGVTTRALARNGGSTWIRIEHQTHPGWNCWLKAVEVSPSSVSIPGCVFPYTVSVQFWITVNGPATVTFQRSLSNGNTAPAESQTYTTFGTYAFSDHLRLGAVGESWFQVAVSSPNAMTGRGTVVASCP